MVELTCEICERAPGYDDGVWRICPDCARLYRVFLDWVKQHPETWLGKLQTLSSLKEALKVARKQPRPETRAEIEIHSALQSP